MESLSGYRLKCMMWKVCRSPTLCRYLQTIIDFKCQKQSSLSCFVLGLSEDEACTNSFENLSVNSLKGNLSNATTSNPPFFSLVSTFKLLTITFVGFWVVYSLGAMQGHSQAQRPYLNIFKPLVALAVSQLLGIIQLQEVFESAERKAI